MADDILKTALAQFNDSEGGTNFNRTAAISDIEFARLGVQWPDKIKQQRQQEGRPCLTINKMPAFIRQVVNDARQNKPSIVITPAEDSDIDTANVIGGLIRQIQRASNADVAYDTALDHAVTCGFGFFRISIDYCNYESFDMEARIERVGNPLSVHWDPNTMAFDSSDWEFAFISDMLTKKQFEKKYPKAAPVDFDATQFDDYINQWIIGEQVRLAEYFLRTEHARKLFLLTDGRVVTEEDLAKQAAEALTMLTMQRVKPSDAATRQFMEMNGLAVSRERETKYYKVKRRVLSGVEILEETDWPGQTIPICPVWGEEVVSEGQRWVRSMVRDARDSQMMFNFWRTASTELVALAPKAPYIVPKDGIPQEEEGKWNTANNRSWPYLVYDPAAGPAPKREGFAGIPAGAIQEALNASDDMKAITGIYDASLGARSNETSGRAILARQREGDISTFHFVDNLNRAIQSAGNILVEIIPSVYSPRSTIRILGEDNTEKVVRLVNESNRDQIQAGLPPEERLYDLSVGKYDVTVKTGPSYNTAREQAVEAMTEIMRAVPGAAQFIGDKLVENMDWPGADVIAKRLKLFLPPQVQQAEGLPVTQPMMADPSGVPMQAPPPTGIAPQGI